MHPEATPARVEREFTAIRCYGALVQLVGM
jgi:hypothetical protein